MVGDRKILAGGLVKSSSDNLKVLTEPEIIIPLSDYDFYETRELEYREMAKGRNEEVEQVRDDE